jgi:hypothetical protein
MNLSHVIASLDARHGGPSKSTRSLAQAQAEQGARVDLFAGSDTPSRETRGQLTTTLLARGWLDRLGVLPGLVTHLRRAEPDLVHVHGLWLRSLGVAHEEAQTRAIPLVVSPRGMMSVWSWQHHRWRKHLAEHWLHPGAFSAAAGWHATSVEEAEEIRSHGFEQPVCVAPPRCRRPGCRGPGRGAPSLDPGLSGVRAPAHGVVLLTVSRQETSA